MDFKEFSKVLFSLENTPKRLEKVEIISNLLSKINTDNYESVLLLLEGRVFPIWSDKKLGVASKLILRAISKAFGVKQSKIEEAFNTNGDLGLCAERFCKNKNQQTLFSFGDTSKDDLTISWVFKNMRKLALVEGAKTVDIKIGLISELLNHADPMEAKYIVRMAIGDLRVGVAFGTIREAILRSIFPKIIGLYDKDELSKKFEGKTIEISKGEDIISKKLSGFKYIKCANYEEARRVYKEISDALQRAYDRLNESYKVATIAAETGLKGLLEVSIEVMNPFKVMLMQKVGSVEEATEKLKFPFALEYKYDGFRAVVHKKGQEVKMFTRNMEEVSRQFPDVVQKVRECVKSENAILDGEILGVDSKGSYLPFQHISQRIKRKHDIEELVIKIPVVYATWDILYLDNESLVDLSLEERRKILVESINVRDDFIVSKQEIINSVEEGDKFYRESLSAGNEGVVVKELESGYKPGNRVGCWLKIKPIMDPLDVVVVGAEWGEGKRATWLTSFVVAVKKDDEFLEIGKVGTGFKELEGDGVSFDEMTKLLKPLIISTKGKSVVVEPKVVLEVAFEEIQKSPTYSSGYALRFPRVIRLKDDFGPDEVDDIEKLKDDFKEQ